MKLYLMEIDTGAPILVDGSRDTGYRARSLSVRALSNFGGVIHAHNPYRHGNSR
jgi:hypothetical protein